jgi:N-acetylglucosamine kinase-like BadF-type ATPase
VCANASHRRVRNGSAKKGHAKIFLRTLWTLFAIFAIKSFSPRDRTTSVAIFLGIDGGGSKTTCVVGDESDILGTATADGSNVIRVGAENACVALTMAIRQACAAAGVNATDIRHACMGVAGAARPEVRDAIQRGVAPLISAQIEIVGDTVISLEAAFGSGPGVIVIAGTGAICYGRNQLGKTARASGWGFAISDEGSGHWIGREAIRLALRAHDEGKQPPLLESAMKALRANSVEQFIVMANASLNGAMLFPAVLASADAGDMLARKVLEQAGRELASSTGIVIRRLFSAGAPTPVAMVGGVFRNSALVRQVFYNSLRSEFPGAVIQETVVDPVYGALALARRGWKSN